MQGSSCESRVFSTVDTRSTISCLTGPEAYGNSMNFLRPSLCESIGDDDGAAEQLTLAVDDVEDFDLEGDKYLQAGADG